MSKLLARPLLVLLLMTFGLAGCESEGPFERAGEEIDKTIEKAGDKVEKATQ